MTPKPKIPPEVFMPRFAECQRLAIETTPAESQKLQDDYHRAKDGPEQEWFPFGGPYRGR